MTSNINVNFYKNIVKEDFKQEDLEKRRDLALAYSRAKAKQQDKEILIQKQSNYRTDNLVYDVGGQLMDLRKYRSKLINGYDTNNPLLNQGSGVMISQKAFYKQLLEEENNKYKTGINATFDKVNEQYIIKS